MRALLILLSFALPALSQESPQTSKPSCIAADVPIYSAGEVKLPHQRPSEIRKAANMPDIRGSMTLELLVNSEGRVCNVRILQAFDRLSAQTLANFLVEHGTLKPATRQGKPVAFKLKWFMDSWGTPMPLWWLYAPGQSER